MNGRAVQYPKSLDKYLRVKKVQLFSVLNRLNFSGQLIWQNGQDCEWILFFNQGHVVYGMGGLHPIRQWYRHVRRHLPHLDLTHTKLRQLASQTSELILPNCWGYQLLHSWLSAGHISQADLQKISCNIIADILFDVMQADDTPYKLVRQSPLAHEQVPVQINEADLLASVKELWEFWHETDFGHCSPNLAPVVQHPDPIRAEVSPQIFQSLMQLLDGQRSLRDLAVHVNRDVLDLTQALHAYIKAGWISLKPVGDFPSPFDALSTHDSKAGQTPCIACIDDSVLVCKSVGQVIRAAGYDFVPIMEPAKAIATLLAKKPDLVFLDLVMPNTSGYEICTQLRKISRFKETPIVILSGNDGLVDQVRARLLGASDFLSKPMEPIMILSVIQKHLGQLAKR
ncbi:response regulator [Oscillatoria sp. CS-180]|uniref:response regulator n=1 Tax=Oscillatoria sp. CS-180 TaxID=3021720 RepID=UPI00232D2C33|nr:response regulator [Oscillatoria sp. CS-180]MDB9528786.1 response regulator [Oscillatoria sp. CS-180]